MSDMKEKLKLIEERRAVIRQGGGSVRIQKQHDQGKLTARERIEKLLDAGTFVEYDMFALPRKTGFDIDTRDLPADGVITGFGKINGRSAYVYAQDFTILGGTVAQVHAHKIIKTMEKALEMRVPCIGMIDSAGVRIQDSFGVQARDTYAAFFNQHTKMSGVVPQISLMMGPCAAGASYSPILTDFVLMVEGTSFMYIAAPVLIQAVTSEQTTEEEIGGPKVHAQISGCCDLVTENDEACIENARSLLGFLPFKR